MCILILLVVASLVPALATEPPALDESLIWAEDPAGAPVIDRGPAGAWDALAVDNPFLFADGDTLHCFYEGQDKPFDQDGHERAGMAVSSDGIRWQKADANPILDVGPPGSWDSTVAKLPVVTRKDDTFYLFYSGRNEITKQIGLATSTDLVHWAKHAGNPVLQSRPDAWDKQLSTHPAPPFELNGRFFLLYRGMSAFYKNQGLGVAVSDDLTHWERATDAPTIATDEEVASLAVTRSADGLVAIAQAPQRAYWHSTDLLKWERAGEVRLTGPRVSTISNPVWFRGGWIVVYEQDDRIYRAVLKQDVPEVIDIGSRRKLFVDHFLIDRLDGATLKLHTPQLAAKADKPRPQGHYGSVLKDGDLFRMYSRGDKVPGISWKTHGIEGYHDNEVTLYAESKDGINWTEPDLGLYQVDRYPNGNVVLADEFLVNHNFTPFIDTKPGVPAEERYKALGGLAYQPHHMEVRDKRGPGGLKAFVSSDGIHWRKVQQEAVIPEDWGKYFDSQNAAFWSDTEQCYLCYFRRIENGVRSIARTTSQDFIHWTDPVLMRANAPGEHLYTNVTQPYFRAPHIYVATPTRFMPDRGSTTDILFMSTRGGDTYDRTFMEAFIRPGVGKDGWGNRSNYAAVGIHQTGPAEMSIFVIGNRRYVLRLDGFASVNAPWEGGELVTKPLRFTGSQLEINCSTSAGGVLRVEIQDVKGQPIPGFTLDDCPQIVGDQIARIVAWDTGADLTALAGKPIRLRFVMEDAALYSLRFRD
jgi:beta-1,4-mannooligosaccharide phosphorylase